MLGIGVDLGLQESHKHTHNNNFELDLVFHHMPDSYLLPTVEADGFSVPVEMQVKLDLAAGDTLISTTAKTTRSSEQPGTYRGPLLNHTRLKWIRLLHMLLLDNLLLTEYNLHEETTQVEDSQSHDHRRRGVVRLLCRVCDIEPVILSLRHMGQ